MRAFQKIFEGLDVIPLLNALARHEELWNANALRTSFPGSPHAQTDDIWLFFNAIPDDESEVVNDILTQPYPAWKELPEVRPLVFGLMHRVGGVQLGRAMITRLPPGRTIPEHADSGAPADYYQRYQFALRSNPGCTFHCGDEIVQFHMGECWWIDNRQPHSVVNNSDDDRLALIVDVRCG